MSYVKKLETQNVKKESFYKADNLQNYKNQFFNNITLKIMVLKDKLIKNANFLKHWSWSNCSNMLNISILTDSNHNSCLNWKSSWPFHNIKN
jgi:hypothetical protein